MSEDGAGCITRGPAVTTDVLQSILLLCYLQLLLAFAVTLLPFTGNYQTKTGVVKYERRNKLWAEATMMLAREESKHLGHSFVRQLPKAAQRLGIMDASDVEYSHLDSDLKVRRSELFADSVPLYTRARRALWILHYPDRAKRTDELSRNRLVTLVRYDHYAFMLAGVLFLTLAFQAASLEERIDAKAESATRCQQRGLCAPVREWTLHRLLWIAWYFVLGGALQSWRARLSFGITKLFFSLSAAPFFPLTISVINKLFTHADPTAYTADGRLTRMDSVGLAAYLVFLRDDVVYSSRFQVEFETDFAASEVERLKAAIVEGQAYLDALWENPIGNIPKRCAKKKKRVEAVVKSVITRQTASDTLYRTVFPNEVLVEEYVAAKAKRKAAAAAREKESAELTRSSTSFRNRKARESAE